MTNKNTLVKSSTHFDVPTFEKIEKKANELADLIELHHSELISILLEYESFEVAEDEISRSLDLLRHIKENQQYFKGRTGSVTSFLPRNQPVYAFTCFVIIPSLMASEVHFRIPHTTKHFFSEILDLLRVKDLFPNVYVSSKERLDFLRQQTALLEDPATKETMPVTSAVIFTGTMANADKLRLIFDKRTLFISNGAGHNPVVISSDADLQAAVEAVTSLQFYNQGQDCAAPNAILIHEKISEKFMELLRAETKATKVGDYHDKACRIGPISDVKDLVRVQEFFIKHREWLDSTTPGIINTSASIVEPTIISKPLYMGGNFHEMFAPVIFAQEYSKDQDLEQYFEDLDYAENAMYVTLYGTSNYVKNLIGKKVHGRVLHDRSTLIHNTHLHAPGVERGTKPYGGFGFGASSVSINGELTALPTLPQRDIYDFLIKPSVNKHSDASRFTRTVYKNVEKLLQIKLPAKIEPKESFLTGDDVYVDARQFISTYMRYVKISSSRLYSLLEEPNSSYAAKLEPKELRPVQALVSLLQARSSLSFAEFEARVYAIPKEVDVSDAENKILQKHFFQNIYQLLLGRNDGPRLAEFLWDLDEGNTTKLLAISDIHVR